MKLNLGCGFNKLDGFVNVDKQPACQPDMVVDLEKLPWPFESGSVDAVVAAHVLEHLGQSPDAFLAIMRELYRVMKPGAKARIVVPHPRSDDFLTDPTHVRPITHQTMQMFSQRHNRETLAKGGANTPLGLYLGIDFEIISVNFDLMPDYVGHAPAEGDTAGRAELARLIGERFNVVRQIDMTIRKIGH